jgi:phosphoribosylglycinamide formyltransferase 1
MKHVVVFSSGGPGNFRTALEFCQAHGDAVRLVGLVTDRVGIPAIDLAHANGIPVSTFHFPALPASAPERLAVCDNILAHLQQLERLHGSLDLIVLAFRKVLAGSLVHAYQGRIINVHPADLSVHDLHSRGRRYVGVGGLGLCLADGARETRTTVHHVDVGVDTGEIIAFGPWTPVDPAQAGTLALHEARQKQISDPPALRRAMHSILFRSQQTAPALRMQPEAGTAAVPEARQCT